MGTGCWRRRAQGPAPGSWATPTAYLVLEQDDELRAQDQALEPSWLHETPICRGPDPPAPSQLGAPARLPGDAGSPRALNMLPAPPQAGLLVPKRL